MIPQTAVDDYHPPWSTFADFLVSRTDLDAAFLTELGREPETRREWTVGAWRGRVAATVEWLTARGVTAGDCVATLAGNTADALALAYACWVHGACCMPLNPHDDLDRQAYILADAGARLLVHASGAAHPAQQLGERTGVPTAAVEELPQREPGEAAVTAGSDPDRVLGTTGADLRSAALRVYTSGTTGAPKGVVLTAANLLTDCDALMAGLEWERGTRVMTVLPVHHVNGLVISSLLPWYAGLSTVLCDQFRTSVFWADAAAERVNVCSVVPSLLEFLLAGEDGPSPDFREFLCGAGPLLTDTVLDFEDRFGVPVRHLYGLSETTAVVTLMPRIADEERRRWYREHGFPSIGPALPHAEVAIVDAEGKPCPAGVRGEIVVRGAMVMDGYAGNAEANAKVMRGGRFHTGDEGFWRPGPNGRPFHFITGRMKELIIRGGVNISPLEIDEVLRSHPAVRFGLAVPFENRYYGEEIAGYVVTDTHVDAEELRDYCADRLDHARCPKVILIGTEVPYTATGKAKRIALAAELAPTLSSYREVQFRRSPSPRS